MKRKSSGCEPDNSVPLDTTSLSLSPSLSPSSTEGEPVEVPGMKAKPHVSNVGRSLLYPTLEELGRALPMPVEEAQKTTVFHQPSFLHAREARRLIRRFARLGLQPYTNVYHQDYNAKGEWVHVTRYLQEGNCFRSKFPRLRARIIDLARRANEEQGWGLDLQRVSIRVAEFHNYRKGGSLPDMNHYDKGSLVTVDVMLHPARYGGAFQTVEAATGGGGEGGSDVVVGHRFEEGDALAFVSHKYHRVSPVEEGERKVLVVEVWSGEERTCGHRCELLQGDCDFEPP